MEHIESIQSEGKLLATIVRKECAPTETTFLTPPEAVQQLGLIAYSKGGKVRRHLHRKLTRTIVGTPEVVIVRSGRCVLNVYDDSKKRVCSRTLNPGDLVALVDCGHEFEMSESTVLFEVKQGPFGGSGDKEYF